MFPKQLIKLVKTGFSEEQAYSLLLDHSNHRRNLTQLKKSLKKSAITPRKLKAKKYTSDNKRLKHVK